jgi:hypothetical protein
LTLPIIIDDSDEGTETVSGALGGDYHDGLLATADLGAALLSMSGYEKPPISDINGKRGNDTCASRMTGCTETGRLDFLAASVETFELN